jgi:large subunit ribosomal protein L13
LPCASRKHSPASTSRRGRRTSTTAIDVKRKYPERLIERAVRGMLPTNKMRDVQLRRLKVYAGSEHPHAPQQPKELM